MQNAVITEGCSRTCLPVGRGFCLRKTKRVAFINPLI